MANNIIQSRPKLIVIDGPDGLGKTTLAESIISDLSASIVKQPSPDNIVGFIRGEVKENPNFTAMERQLLIAVSHTVDAFSRFTGSENIVMDRSYLSGLVYGKLTGVSNYNLVLIRQLLSTIYTKTMGEKYDVHIIFVTGSKRFDQPDEDFFESSIPWDQLNNDYVALYNSMVGDDKLYAFSNEEKVSLVDMTGGTKEENLNKVRKLINV